MPKLNYDKAMRIISANERRLTLLLKDKERALFLDYVKAQSELNSVTAIEYFAEGFALGAKTMLEVMPDSSACLCDT